MKTIFKIGLSLSVLMALTGCGGGSDDSGSGDSGVTFPDPIVAYTETKTFDNGTQTMEVKLGADGKLQATRIYDYPAIAVKDDIGSFTIQQLTSTTTVDAKYVDGSTISGTATYDFGAGTEHIEIQSSEFGSANCTNHYASPLPFYIDNTNANDIPTDFDSSTMISTDCPAWVNDENDEDLDIANYTMVMNTTITDTDNEFSHISEYINIK